MGRPAGPGAMLQRFTELQTQRAEAYSRFDAGFRRYVETKQEGIYRCVGGIADDSMCCASGLFGLHHDILHPHTPHCMHPTVYPPHCILNPLRTHPTIHTHTHARTHPAIHTHTHTHTQEAAGTDDT